MKYEIRPYCASDVRFVMTNWLDTWRVNKHAGVVRNSTYYTETRSLIEDLLARGMKILVADAGDTLLGFVAYEKKDNRTVVHYLWTKAPYLNTAVSNCLLAATDGEKPGHFTFYNRRLEREGFTWSPEMCRRKDL